MAMPATHTDWTVEMLDALPDDGQRYEIIDGELFVTPRRRTCISTSSASCTRDCSSICVASGVGHPVVSPADVRREDRRRNRVQPDIFVVRVRDNKRPAYPFDLDRLAARRSRSRRPAIRAMTTRRSACCTSRAACRSTGS